MRFFFFEWKEWQGWIETVKGKIPVSVWKWKKTDFSPLCRILCVDDDRNFYFYIQRIASHLGIELDAAFSIKEAKRKIKEGKKDYQAFIIDGHLPDGSGFDLIAWIRKKKEKKVPIVFLSRFYQDATSFRILKEEWQVDYVFEKPLSPIQVEQLLAKLCHLVNLREKDSFPEKVLDDLKQKYKEKIFDKLTRLQNLILTLQRDPTLKHLENLKNEVHQIGGSAGSYGYPQVSQLCKKLENDLIEQMALVQKGTWDFEALYALDDFFKEIKIYFQMDEDGISPSSPNQI